MGNNLSLHHYKETFPMRYNGILHYGIILMITTIVLWGCPKKSEITASPEVQKENVTSPATPGVAETGTNGKSASLSESSGEAKDRAMANRGALQPIYFDFNKSFVRDDAKSVLKRTPNGSNRTQRRRSRSKAIVTSKARRNTTRPLASDARSAQKNTLPKWALLPAGCR